MTTRRVASEKLGIPIDAPPQLVRSAYRRLALKLHPDKNFTLDAAHQFQQILAARDIMLEEGAVTRMDPSPGSFTSREPHHRTNNAKQLSREEKERLDRCRAQG
ncbi:conserved hypothetical protein [Perkinsus marinus ATCC 50983]|uniref:J domain-containing protein n=1 Tax=Perkinsus marinus (strain ATCC 50983 / TXsc) TaxID=423536 RepID=C5K5S8_PERM5|nr:conserved hypothetical protein [Perkinsus marinus ATCC 50983]EER20165.1 conserved hypothetical protein [Perkinsus marinus ATCC 50983]|eukprot:XP_002788369.1 conserved hypothetical protein [Perkinsus marinus ATCC 50983]